MRVQNVQLSGSNEPNYSNLREIGIGMLWHGFMGKAHTNALKKIPYIFWPPPAVPKHVAICGSKEEAVREAAARYGYKRYTTSWEELVADPEVELVINAGPNALHADPCIAAAKAGKHVLCEKPLAPLRRQSGCGTRLKRLRLSICAALTTALCQQFDWRKR